MKVTKLKTNLQKHGRKTMLFSAACVLVLASFIPIIKARAIDNQGSYAKMNMRNATGITIEDANITASYNGGEVSVTDAINPVKDVEQNHNYGDGHFGDMQVLYTKSNSLTFTAYPNENYQAEARINGQLIELTNNSYTWSGLQTADAYGDGYRGYEIEFSFRDDGGHDDENSQPVGNKTATLCVNGGNGSYERPYYNEATGEESTETIHYADTYDEAHFAINDGFPIDLRPEGKKYDQETGAFICNELTYQYDGEDTDTTIKLHISTLWHLKLVNNIVVNGTPYVVSDIDYDNKESWLAHYDHQEVGIDLTVPKAEDDTYNITVDVASGGQMFIGNFLWTADPAQEFMRDPSGEYILDENGNKIRGYDYIGHSSLALAGVAYTVGGIDYACDEATLAEDACHIPYLEYSHDGSVEYDDGSLVVPAGARVTMRVIPDRGYQVTNVNVAELTTTDEGVGEFTFTVPAGAAYFVADVVEVEDKVDAEAEAIESGSITIDDGESAIDYGTAKLEVKDVDLDGEDIEGFEDAADGYNISTYLDISLFKTLYKGTETDTWDEQIDELDGEATITLKLEEGVDGNEVVIVHQKHDGSYEVIPTTYDPVAHAITFKTSSFSNYAIASRTVATPDTGANVSERTSAATAIVAEITIMALLAVYTIYIAKRIKRDQQ